MKSLGSARRKRRVVVTLVAAAIVLVIVGAVAVTVMWLQSQQSSGTSTKQTSRDATIVPEQPVPTKVTSNILVLGNTFWGRYIHDWSMKSELKYKYPFSRLHEFDRDKYDAWISGLECPTAPGVNVSSAEQERLLSFNCPPEYLSEAAKWFTAFTLANNHTDNQGIDGFAATQQQLDKHGIQYFGHYDPRALDDVCDVISLPVTVHMSNGTTQQGKLPVAMCGYHGVFRIPPAESIAVMNQYSPHMPVFAFPHMGLEYKPAPDQLKITTYRAMIDNGADVVFGDHPHWIQNTESYKGKLIAYSMGNFMFDQQGTSEVTRSAGINLLLQTADSTDSDLLNEWLRLGEACATYHDDCLEQARELKLQKVLYTYTYSIVGTDDGDKIVKPATKDQQTAILQRLDWARTSSQLTSKAF